MKPTEHYYISSNKFSTHERLTKRGRVYDIVFRIVTMEGVEKQKKLSGFRTKSEAKQAYLDFVQSYCELAKGKAIRKPTVITPSQTISELIMAYINALGNQNKDSSIYDKRNIFAKFVIPQLGSTCPIDLTKTRLLEWQDKLWTTRNPKTGDYYSYNYLSKIRMTMSAFLSWLSDRHDVPNYLRAIRKPKRRTQKTEMLFWTQEQFNHFISIVDNPTYKAMYCIMFYTGRRKGEVIALQGDDVMSDKIRFNKTYSRKTIDNSPYIITTTKNERSAVTKICAPLQAALKDYEPQAPFFFGGETPIHENTLAHAFDRYIKKAQLPRIRMHDLRHSFVSMCIHLGASVYVVASLIGDTPEQVLKTYGHLYDEDKTAVIQRIL